MFQQDLIDLLQAREPGIWIRSSEEKEVLLNIRNALEFVIEYDYIYTWSISEGAEQLIDEDDGNIMAVPIPQSMGLNGLNNLLSESNSKTLEKSKVWVLKDYHLALNNPQAIRIIRDLKESPIAKYTPIIIISPSSEIPLELQSTFKLIEYDVPCEEDIVYLIKAWGEPKEIALDEEEYNLLAKRLYGFTRSEIIKMLNISYVKYKYIDLDIITQKKIEVIKESGVLDYKEPVANLDDVGGNNKFKEWIEVVEACMTEDAKAYGIPSPKGYLSVGIPGTSKTFSAEALAGKWGIPFIKLNMAKIN